MPERNPLTNAIGAVDRVQLSMPMLRAVDAEIKFECQKCGDCCTKPIILSSEDINRLGSRLDTLAQAMSCSKSQVMRPSSQGTCHFLRNGNCSVYDSRPSACQSYPFYRIGTRIYYDAKCTGIGVGRSYSTEELSEMVSERLAGIPEQEKHTFLGELLGMDPSKVLDDATLSIVLG